MIILPFTNGDPEWYAARRGMITASGFKAALTNSTKGVWPGETALKYCLKVASERMGDEEDEVETWQMRRGSLLEPEALDAYQDHMMRDIVPASFVAHDTLPVSCTPDGFLVDPEGKGTVECKCRTAARHAAYMIAGRPTDEDLYQIQGNLWLTGMDYCDFVSYRPLLRKERDRLLVFRIRRDEFEITKIALGIQNVVAKVDELAKQLGVDDWKPYHLGLAA